METTAKKILTFASSKEHYDAEACIVWCFDDRFFKLLDAFIKEKGFKNVDVVKDAGGAKALATDQTPECDFIVNQIKASVRLHKTKNIVLMLHMDCGAYGGSKAFDNDQDAEFRHHSDELNKVRNFINREFPELSAEFVIGTFDGLYKVA